MKKIVGWALMSAFMTVLIMAENGRVFSALEFVATWVLTVLLGAFLLLICSLILE